MSQAYEPVIGLEIHVQLKTKTKLFCASPNSFDVASPNTNICEICTGQPGTLPKLNAEAVKKAIQVGLALNCEIAQHTKFDRKNYFYPDLPKGYQISQFDQPINGRGEMVVSGKKFGITRAHLEEDAGKLIHADNGKSLVDFNRTGVPLLEIVTEPDFRSSSEAAEFLRNLRNIVRYLDASEADMEKGQLRVDANVSIRKVGETKLPPYKVEVKNMNSFKAVEQALEYEIQRQTELLEQGKQPIDETRGFVDATRTTVSQRTKEAAHDYRYFPEPDLPMLEIPKAYVEELKHALPELPEAKRVRFAEEYGLPAVDIAQLVDDRYMANYFEEAASELKEIAQDNKWNDEFYRKGLKTIVNLMLGDFQALLNRDGIKPEESKLEAYDIAEIAEKIVGNDISVTAAKAVLGELFDEGGDVHDIITVKNLAQVSDTGEIEQAVDKILAANPEIVEKYKSGKTSVVGALVGQVMREMGGKANPQVVNEILKQKLENG